MSIVNSNLLLIECAFVVALGTVSKFIGAEISMSDMIIIIIIDSMPNVCHIRE